MTKRIGIIGVGAMGGGIAKTLLEAGYSVTAFDVNTDALEKVSSLGALAASSPAKVGCNSDVVITSLPNPEIFEDVVLGTGALLEAMESGSYILDMSTIDPGTTKRINRIAGEKGVHTLDAPLSGGPAGAASGSLTIIVGATKEDFEALNDIFKVLGKNVFHVGPVGAGQTVKVCNNAAAAVHTVVTGEVLLAGVKAGVDLKVLSNAISSASGGSWILQNFFPKTVLKGAYSPPLFALDLMLKDLGLYIKTIEELGLPSMTASLAHQIYKAGHTTGKGKEDHTGVVRVLEELSGFKIGTVED
jgi:3-hydroxyisobutyrate dehydrogenase-like beta-hydroxyacid dehydrogenase